MAVTVYRSTDASAPVLDGTAGSLVNLLDKCLVAGYGAFAGAGWTKPFTGINKAAFRQGAGPLFYLDVDDSGPGAATTREARIRGYEAMTGVGVGANAFPTAAQLVGPNCRKSVTADATTRPWLLVADNRTFYFFAQTEGSTQYWGFMFGEIFSLAGSGDSYRCQLVCRGTENSVVASNDALGSGLFPYTGAMSGHFITRDSTGLGGSKSNAKVGGVLGGAMSASGGYIGPNGAAPVPNTVDGKLYFAPIIVGSDVGAVRGRLRGAYEPQFKATGYADGDTVAGDGALAGHTLLLVKGLASSAANATFAIDITGPWETN